MSLGSIASAVGTFVRNTAGSVSTAALSGIEKAAAGGERAAETTAQGALASVAKRVADDPTVTGAINKLGQIAAKPTSQALQPHIIAAAVAAVVGIAVVVYIARK